MSERGVQKKLVGIVVGNRMDKSAMVLVERLTKHKTYRKYVKRRSKYMVHDPKNICDVGDKVRIVETRPISKRKRWRVLDIIKEGVK